MTDFKELTPEDFLRHILKDVRVITLAELVLRFRDHLEAAAEALERLKAEGYIRAVTVRGNRPAVERIKVFPIQSAARPIRTPRIITLPKLDKALDLIAGGMSVRKAAAALGLNYYTLYDRIRLRGANGQCSV